MGRPMLLYGLLPLVNGSFEDDAASPAGWTASGTGAVHTIVSDPVQSAGDGIPSARALRQTVVDGTAGNKAVLTQRLDLAGWPAWLRTGAAGPDAPELAAVAMLHGTDAPAQRMARLRLRQYGDPGATTTPGSGTEITTAHARRAEHGEDLWVMRLAATTVDSAAIFVDVELSFDPAGETYNGESAATWDRVFVGGLVDLARGFRKFDLSTDPGFEVNEGNGTVEFVKVRKPRTEITAELTSVAEGSAEDLALKRMVRWLAGSTPGPLVLWQDRNLHTNETRHFQRVVWADKIGPKYPPGVVRRNYALKLVAPSEAC